MASYSSFSPPPRILLMDGDESSREHLLAILFWSGYEVDDVSLVSEAWQALNTTKYDLLIAENKLPDLQGFELLGKLRSARSALPVIIASFPATNDAVCQFPPILPAATIMKPYAEAQLLETVSDALNSSDQSRNRTSQANSQEVNDPSSAQDMLNW